MMHLYSVYDQKSEVWGAPFPLRSNGEAVRGFQDACSNKDSMLGKYPADFVLFQIGTFDDATGVLMPCDNPINLGAGGVYDADVVRPVFKGV